LGAARGVQLVLSRRFGFGHRALPRLIARNIHGGIPPGKAL
jgi:hypothetical protein